MNDPDDKYITISISGTPILQIPVFIAKRIPLFDSALSEELEDIEIKPDEKISELEVEAFHDILKYFKYDDPIFDSHVDRLFEIFKWSLYLCIPEGSVFVDILLSNLTDGDNNGHITDGQRIYLVEHVSQYWKNYLQHYVPAFMPHSI